MVVILGEYTKVCIIDCITVRIVEVTTVTAIKAERHCNKEKLGISIGR